MKLLLSLLLGYAWCASKPISTNQYLEATSSLDPRILFRQWSDKFKKTYQAAGEFERRLEIFADNLAFALKVNAQDLGYTLGMNAYADLTHSEFKERYLGLRHDAPGQLGRLQRLKNAAGPTPFRYADVDEAALPDNVDWREAGAVSEVKNQGQCGSCWAFSTTGSIEGVVALSTGKMISLSEQELIDCDLETDYGCQGGLMDNAFQWVIKNKGLDTESDWPYTAEQGVCDPNKKVEGKISSIDGFEDVPVNDEKALKKAVAHQPVSVAIQANTRAFQLYINGIFADNECGTDLDHGVLAVGYGMKTHASGRTVGYWIVKNSWGPLWGMDGYIWIKAYAGPEEGMCGIAMAASYPTRKDQPPPSPPGPRPPRPGPKPPTPHPSPPAPAPAPGPDPSPSQKPVMCDLIHSCPAQTTCCCNNEIMQGICWEWACCPMEEAVCCEDKEHCCPSELPVCNLEQMTCDSDVDPHYALSGRSEPMREKIKADRRFMRSRVFGYMPQ